MLDCECCQIATIEFVYMAFIMDMYRSKWLVCSTVCFCCRPACEQHSLLNEVKRLNASIEEWDYWLRLIVCHDYCSSKSRPVEILMQLNYVITLLTAEDCGLCRDSCVFVFDQIQLQ